MLTALILVSGVVYLWAATRQIRSLVYLLKPGTMLLIIALAAQAQRPPLAPYALIILAALLFSLAGDIFLMLPRERFAAGLASFLIAHLLYAAALWTPFSAGDAVTALLLAVLGAFMYTRLSPGVPKKLKIPVAFYLLAISFMVWRAAGAMLQPGPLPFRPALTAAGAVLFYISDGALAWDRFIRRLPARHFVVMSTYFAAQFLFAASVAWPPGE